MTIIQTNLAALGLPPLPSEVRVTLRFYEDDTLMDMGAHNLEGLVTDSSTRHSIWRQARERSGKDPSYQMMLEADGGWKATLSSDGDVTLEEANLRTTYLVQVVTEWGKNHVLDVEKMLTDRVVSWMLDYVRNWYEQHPLHYNKDGSVQEYHSSEGRTASRFMSSCRDDGTIVPSEVGFKDFFRYQKETQFGDGYCGAVGGMWRAACWELFGEARNYPYSFAY